MNFGHSERGVTLLAAMIVLVVLTLLVVGAIAFTGNERVAASRQVSAEALDACAIAAKNLFLSRITLAFKGGVTSLPQPNESVTVGGATGITLFTGHFDGKVSDGSPGTVDLLTAKHIDSTSFADAVDAVDDLTNTDAKDKPGTGYYALSATCKDNATGAQQEFEFTIHLAD